MPLHDGFPIPHATIEWAKDPEIRIKTLPQLFRSVVKKHGDRPYVGKRVGKKFEFKTYNQIHEEVRCFASNLIELGFEKEERVANYCNNRPEWPVIDLGTTYIGCVHVPMYPTLSQSEMSYIVRGSQARLLVVASKEQLARAIAEADNCFHLRHIVSLEPVDRESVKSPDGVRLWDWEEFIQAGREALTKNKNQIDRMCKALKATDVASFVYTSGTTGDPKGAMLMHGGFVALAVPCAPNVIQVTDTDVQLSFLPLSHVFERIMHYAMMSRGAAISFSKSIATVTTDMLLLRPNIVPSVPRLFEKVYDKAMESASKGMRKKIMEDALDIGKRYRLAQQEGKVSSWLKAQHAIFDKLVYSKIREKVGGQVRFFISGGAPLRRDVAEFFLNVGLRVLEGYGLTEASPLLAVNLPELIKIGTVGCAPKYVQIKVLDDGEIVARGPNVMLGYFGNPEATREVIDKAGWLHTGDIGEIDEDGYLTITDRKKEILVLSNGKNVAPQPIELSLCASPYIAQAVLVGNNRGYVSAILAPSFTELEQWANDKQLSFANREELVALPQVVAHYKEIVRQVCAPLSSYENIRQIHIMNREFSAELGEITPTLKVKRRIVENHFKDEIEAMYKS